MRRFRGSRLPLSAGLLVLSGLLAACNGLPVLNAQGLPPRTEVDTMPIYRDLATIPPPPPVTSRERRTDLMEALSKDQEAARNAAVRLHEEPVFTPAPPPPGL